MYLFNQFDLRDVAAIQNRKIVLPGEPNPEWLRRDTEVAQGLAEIRAEKRLARAGRGSSLRSFLRLGFGRE